MMIPAMVIAGAISTSSTHVEGVKLHHAALEQGR